MAQETTLKQKTTNTKKEVKKGVKKVVQQAHYQKQELLQQAKSSQKKVQLTFFSKIIEVLGNTEKYFTTVKNEGYGEPLLYYLPFMIISAILGALTLPEVFSLPLTAVFFVLVFIGEVVAQLAMGFFMAWLTQVCLRICKGQGRYLDTFKAGVYASTPTLLWNVISGLLALVLTQQQTFWLLFPSLAFLIWSICLTVVGLSQYHAVNKSRAFWAGIVLPLTVFGVGIFVVVFFFVLLGLIFFAGMTG
ncbi:YIP1 family protein [Candidatus Woesearchaeota archaeon]|nr:YIP1 family protein [Candidatus Woesearchaeota archaeon]